MQGKHSHTDDVVLPVTGYLGSDGGGVADASISSPVEVPGERGLL